MTTIGEIAADPSKALANLESDLGVEPGTLLREAADFAEEVGDWREHLPYTVAAAYYKSRNAQAFYQSHVDKCAYCKRLLETLHPSDLQTREFTKGAVRRKTHKSRRLLPAYWVPTAASASIVVSFFAVPQLQMAGLMRSPSQEAMIVHALRTQPNLVRLEKSDKPVERYLAARYYFDAGKPQLAWQQIGRGLQLAGVYPVDAERIITAADLPPDEWPQMLVKAAQRLSTLKAVKPEDPTVFLERAEVQAKLGLNTQALSSIQAYLKARNVDSKALADFSVTTLAEPSKLDATEMATASK